MGARRRCGRSRSLDGRSRTSRAAPPLTEESAGFRRIVSPVAVAKETQELWFEYRRSRDRLLRDRLILTYAPLVKFVAGRVGASLPSHVDEQDVVSYGLVGLIGAIERFEQWREIKFESFAMARIRGAMIEWMGSLASVQL